MDKLDEWFPCILDAAARIKKREDQLRPIKTVSHTRLTVAGNMPCAGQYRAEITGIELQCDCTKSPIRNEVEFVRI
jgi:hypothetical protein